MNLIRALNVACGGRRASPDEVAMDSVALELRNLLEEVSGRVPDLTARCADLPSRLDEVFRGLLPW